MVIERLLGEMSPAAFLERHYYRLPLSRPGAARELAASATWKTVEHVLGRKDVDAFLARDGKMKDGGSAPSYAKAREQFSEGCTLVIRNAERHHPDLERLAAGFHEDLGAPVNVHLYATPAGTTGFGWHYDVEDVFILQGQGDKEYRLRKNTVHPWPVLRTMLRDLRFEREITPLLTCMLSEGDWLYIPPGWWHRAESKQDSLTLAVGLMSPTALDFLDFLREELARSVVRRQRLPSNGRAGGASPAQALEAHRPMLSELGRDLAKTWSDDTLLRRFLESQGVAFPGDSS